LKSIEERIKGLMLYYQMSLSTESFSDVNEGIHSFGKRTQKKVRVIVDEAHNHGVVLGLTEALNVLQTQEMEAV